MTDQERKTLDAMQELLVASYTAASILVAGEPYPNADDGTPLTREDLLDELTFCALLVVARCKNEIEGGKESRDRTYKRLREERGRRDEAKAQL